MSTAREKQDFEDFINDEIELSIAKNILESTLQYVRSNFDPDDIWDDDKLRKYVAASSLPEDVFEDKQLSEWAESNGYEKV